MAYMLCIGHSSTMNGPCTQKTERSCWRSGASGWVRSGVQTKQVSGDGETHYHCLFCDDNLATLANKGGVVPPVWLKKLTTHTELCAMRFLRDNVLAQRELPRESFVLEHDEAAP